MIIDVSDYYKKKGYITAYLAVNKEPRRVCTLRMADGTMISMAYAKYLYTSYHNCDIEKGDQIDHINGDKLDDRIENLQKISRAYNIKKDKHIKEYVERINDQIRDIQSKYSIPIERHIENIRNRYRQEL